MLCLPAFTPVANDAQAVGDSGEWLVSSRCSPPRLTSFCMFGSLPWSIHFLTRAGSMPSKPRITSFCGNFSAGRVPQATAKHRQIDTRAAGTLTTTDEIGEEVEENPLPFGCAPAGFELNVPRIL